MEALREIVINAIVHRDYSSSSDSIVKIFDDRIEIFNPGPLQPGLTVERLLAGDYVSSIRNRKIADMFKEVGLIEKYGTGIRRILDGFKKHGLPEPRFEEIGGGFRVTAFKKPTDRRGTERGEALAPEVTPEVTPEVERLLGVCLSPTTRKDLQQALGLCDEKHFRTAYMQAALRAGLIERTIQDKPRSRLQRYRLTQKGKAIVASQVGKNP